MASNAAVPFWRSTGMTYITYSNLCANLVRLCLKEPYKSEALNREKVHFSVSQWVDGKPQKPNMQNQLVCSRCRTILLYHSRASNLCCAICNMVTAVPPSEMDMAQLICGGCRTLLMHSRGAASVRCSCCHTANLVLGFQGEIIGRSKIEPGDDGRVSLDNFRKGLACNATDAMQVSRVPDILHMMSPLSFKKMEFDEFCAAAISTIGST